MKPVISLVGRPNVGKSTLFNRLTRTRDALVADFPGLTRDRKYGIGRVGEIGYLVVDTGGLGDEGSSIGEGMAEQARVALKESHVILLLVDARDGLTATDQLIADELRSYDKPVVLVVNKTDGVDADQACAEFHELGLGEPHPISSAHGRGLMGLMTYALSRVATISEKEQEHSAVRDRKAIRIAFVGRPNVGKSTLINRLLGEQRLLTLDQPGTTRDSIEIPFQRNGQRYILIDTAGVRRRARVEAAVEKFSVVKSLQAIDSAQVAILVMDARQGIADQDARLLGLVLESGCALVLAINKWDGLSEDEKLQTRRELDLRLSFINYAERHMISALHGTGVGKLLRSVNTAYRSAMIQVGTAELTRLLQQAVETHPPPLVRGRRIKLRYAHQGGHNPPLFILYGNQTQHVPDAYRRYLTNYFAKALRLLGTPLRLLFKTGENPYAGRRNKLTPRQQRKRKRLLRHTRRG